MTLALGGFLGRGLSCGGQALILDAVGDMRRKRACAPLDRRFVDAQLPGDRPCPAGLVEQ